MIVETFVDPMYEFATRESFPLIVTERTIETGQGGGWVGAEIYAFWINTVGEIPAFFVVLGWMVISVMLATRTTAGELAVFMISVYRSFMVAMDHRSQKRRAIRLQLEQQKTEQAQFSVSKPAAGELAAGAQGALPAPADGSSIERRAIPIRMGGQTISAQPAQQEPELQPALPAAVQEETSSGGLFSRLRSAVPSALPFGGSGDDQSSDSDNNDKSGGRLLGGLLGSRTTTNGSDDQPAPRPAAPPQRPAASAAPATPLRDLLGKSATTEREAVLPAASAAPPAPTTLPGQSTSGSRTFAPRPFTPPSPFGSTGAADIDDEDDEDEEVVMPRKPAAFTPPPARPSPVGALPKDELIDDDLDDDDEFDDDYDDDFEDEFDDEDEVIDMTPARPKGIDPRPPLPPQPFGKSPTPANETVDASAASSLSDRLSRLNQIRSGQTAKSDTETPAASLAPEDAPVPAARTSPTNGERSASPRPFSPFSKPEKDENGLPAQRSAFTPPTAHASTPPKPVEIEEEDDDFVEPVINPPRPTVAIKPTMQTPVNQTRKRTQWRLPDYRTLFASGSEQDFDRETLVRRARLIEETLQSFGAPGKVVEINTGPVITQFGVEPDYMMARGGKKSRVKVGAIAQLDKDLQLALGAKSIRIEAPVPGKGFVGIEVPNDQPSLVSLRDVMESPQFATIDSPLAIALGQSVDGAPVSADLTQMPHLLIAGTTGSGKSVCVNSIIASLIVRNTPDQVKFIMVDPKRFELTGYNGIPHLVAPVVVELERIVGVLKWVTREMDERYKKFSNAGARNIEDYNIHREMATDPMPYIVVIIDELADLMMLAPDETERVVTRIAALARATGIHLVIATQRPSVDVVTGLIKANFPARIAFAVAGGVDSRVILDQPGAEKLLGKGDMLYMSPDSPAPLRLQGVFVSDMEINNINRYWRSQAPEDAAQKPITSLVMDSSPVEESRSVMPRGERFSMTPPPSTQTQNSGKQQAFWDANAPVEHSSGYGMSDRENDDDHEDELYEEAVELVRRLNKASVSLLQRRLRIGYTRAARLIDVMEAEGVVGPPTEGSKPRVVLPEK
jgi:S-DNA-T family DNA segregation ATPase FtsK/SpoIIIE